jgi:hypothetical protein
MIKTLRKLLAEGDPKDALVDPLLKELEQTLARFQRSSGQRDAPKAMQAEKQSDKDPETIRHELPPPRKSRIRKDNLQPDSIPAPAE